MTKKIKENMCSADVESLLQTEPPVIVTEAINIIGGDFNDKE